MDETKARAVHPAQLTVLEREACALITSVEHAPDKDGHTITVSANGARWRMFKDYSEAQKFLAGAISGARLRNTGGSDA